MSSIDNRIVNMQFNNKGFESGVATTLNSLKKLNESLKMKNASKGLTDVSDSLNKVNSSGMSGLSRGIEAVTSRFSTLGVIATTSLMNITNKAVNAGTALAKSLTIDPVLSGFSEYETKMGAIQTILTNTAHEGKTLTDVTAVLDELNTYADQTIYSFEEMTKNIGTFTAAGVGLETSAAAIKGIANLAAASGSNSQQASTAMYQLSQALAAGKVSLADWNSVVNAGMGGKLFQDALIRTSEVLGTGAEDMIKKYGSFRESLTKGEWLTSEVLTETLKQLSGAYTEADLIAQGFSQSQAKQIVELAKNATAAATEVKTVTQLLDTMKESVQSGWAQSWEHIIGDKDQATKTLTAISDKFNEIIGPSTKARNEMLKFWNEAGGRDDLITGLGNVFGSLGKVLGSVKDAFREVFPAMTGQKLVELTEGFKKFTEKIKISDETAKKIKDTFQGVFSVFGIVGDAFKSVVSVFSSGVGILGKVGNAALTVTSSIGKFFTNIYESLHASRIFENAANTIKAGLNSVERFFGHCGEAIGSFMGNLSKLDFSPLFDFISEIGGKVGEGLVDIFSGLGEAISNIDLNTILGALAALSFKDIFTKISDGFSGFMESLGSFAEIGEGITGILDGLKNSLRAFQTDLSAGTLLKIASAVGILAASLAVLASIEPSKMDSSLGGITILLAELMVGMSMLTGLLSGGKIKGLMSLSTTLLALSAALLVMSAAVRSMASLSWNEIAVGLVGVAGSMLVLVAAMKLLSPLGKGMVSTAAGMIAVAAALVVMAQAIKTLGQLEFGDMLQGLLGVGVALAELALFTKFAKMDVMGVKSSTGILLLAASLLVLQNAVKKFGEMDIGALITGLGSVGMLLAELALFSTAMQGTQGLLSTSAAMVVMAGAINLMVPAVRSLGNLSWEEIARGLVSLAGALTVLGVASAVISGAKLASVGAGLAVMSAAMLVLSSALKSMGGMSWEQIAKSLVTLAGALVIFAAAMAAMSGGLAGAAAMLVMAGALAVFTPQLIAMASLSWGQIAAGLTMLAGAFTVIGVAGLVLTPLVPVLIALAAAITLLGVGCAAAGAGVALFGTGLATIAAVGAGAGLALAEVLRQLSAELPNFAAACGDAIVEFAKAIGEGMPAMATAMGQCMIGILQAVSDAIPKIVQVGLELLTAFCDVLLQGTPQLIDVAVNLIIALVEGLASNIGKITDAAIDLIINFIDAITSRVGEIIQAGIDLGIAVIEGLADGITNNQQRVEDAMEKLAKALLDAFKSMLGINSPSTKMKEAGVDTIEGLLNGIESKVEEVKTKMKNLASDMIKAIKDKIQEWYNSGKEIISNLVNGISEKATEVKTKIQTTITNAVIAAKTKASEFLSAGREAISNLVSGIDQKASEVKTSIESAITRARTAVSNKVGEFKSIGINIINGLKNGITSAASSVAEAARNVVQRAIDAAKSVLKINSPSRVFMEIGDYTVQGLVKGIEDNANTIDKPATNLARRAVESVSNTISAISNALNGEIDTSLVITPVMDLSNVEAGTRTIRDIMAANSQFSINADATNTISRSIGNIQNGSESEQIVAALRELKASMANNGNTTYQINGITYDDGSNITSAVETLVRAARIERRV